MQAIEAILDSREEVGEGFQYKILWRGYSNKDRTQEPLCNIVHCTVAIKDYERRYSTKSKPTSAEIKKAKGVAIRQATAKRQQVATDRAVTASVRRQVRERNSTREKEALEAFPELSARIEQPAPVPKRRGRLRKIERIQKIYTERITTGQERDLISQDQPMNGLFTFRLDQDQRMLASPPYLYISLAQELTQKVVQPLSNTTNTALFPDTSLL